MRFHSLGKAALFWLVAGTILWGCGGSGSDKGSGGVAGTVVARMPDPADAQNTVLVGVADATVQWGTRSTRTNYGGSFVLDEVEEGFQAIRATKRIANQTWTGFATVEVLDRSTVVNANITLWSQNQVGSLVGEVRDDAGRALQGAKVFIASELGSYTTFTNRSGRYDFIDIPGGQSYTVTASLIGYENDIAAVTIATGGQSTVNFRLTPSFNASLSPPRDLMAVAWTYPDSLSRTRNRAAYDRIRADLMPRLKAVLAARKPQTRIPPADSVIEVDLAWTSNNLSYPDEINLAGYAIYRQIGNLGGLEALDFLRDPLAGFYSDLDTAFTPGVSTRYRITALNTDYPESGSESSDSNEARVTPLNRVLLTGPSDQSNTGGQPTFSWSSVTGSQRYLIRIYDNFPTFGLGKPVWQNAPEDPIEAEVNGLSIRYDGEPLQTGYTYYWIVAAFDNADITQAAAISVSQIRQFTVR
ncbi:MAG: carboxypeptidase regulatory-like domain-containing protein [Armatimonadetes bacterium]|nr:carboxypeptidase regulatory-like domain-containing protein [Armatimonadota bacterium]